jgi:hypothetical protein
MAAPTVDSRLQRRFAVLSNDGVLVAQLRSRLPQGWTMSETTDLAELGGFADVLQYRFILLDLDAARALDPLEAVRQVRGDMMLNVPIFCFGGTPQLRDEARLARADRFFDRAEISDRLAAFCEQFGW